jgi:hypothetical protein
MAGAKHLFAMPSLGEVNLSQSRVVFRDIDTLMLPPRIWHLGARGLNLSHDEIIAILEKGPPGMRMDYKAPPEATP